MNGGELMDAVIAEKYRDIKFDKSHLEMICEMIKSDEDEAVIKVLQEFLNDEVKKMNSLDSGGVTKKQIMELKVNSSKLDKANNTFIDAKINITKPRCNNIISFLDGATLIYHGPKDRQRERPLFLTKRGIQVCTELLNRGILKKPNL